MPSHCPREIADLAADAEAGENAYPAEVGATLAELADVAECAVLGIADERVGEVGRPFVVGRAGAVITERVILDHCRTRSARFKVPASVRLVSNLPRTAFGKVQKHQLDRTS
ncbi:MAG: hypothetical protein ABIO85_06355 [Sphingomicrobium sp.]